MPTPRTPRDPLDPPSSERLRSIRKSSIEDYLAIAVELMPDVPDINDVGPIVHRDMPTALKTLLARYPFVNDSEWENQKAILLCVMVGKIDQISIDTFRRAYDDLEKEWKRIAALPIGVPEVDPRNETIQDILDDLRRLPRPAQDDDPGKDVEEAETLVHYNAQDVIEEGPEQISDVRPPEPLPSPMSLHEPKFVSQPKVAIATQPISKRDSKSRDRYLHVGVITLMIGIIVVMLFYMGMAGRVSRDRIDALASDQMEFKTETRIKFGMIEKIIRVQNKQLDERDRTILKLEEDNRDLADSVTKHVDDRFETESEINQDLRSRIGSVDAKVEARQRELDHIRQELESMKNGGK